MTDHPLTETAAAELWDASRDPRRPLADRHEEMHHDERATPADPYHDPRPWQDCTREDIRKGDMVEALNGDRLHVGVAHRQDEYGNWYTKVGYFLTSGTAWPLRRIPAPTPPAEEVELPGKHPAHITDVEHTGGIVCAYMALDNAGDWCGVSTQGLFCDWSPHELAAFTLPDGTRARRDGKHGDGTPRFVKVEADQ